MNVTSEKTDDQLRSVPVRMPRNLATVVLGLVVAMAVCFSAAAIGGFATSSSVDDWYVGLNKPSFNPPNWIFAPVWSLLYFMMSVSVWLVWKDSRFSDSRVAIAFFGFHLVLNVLWSVMFFGMQQPGIAMICIIALWCSIVITMKLFTPFSKLAAGLLGPYLAWVTFASALNYAIWSLN